MRIKQELDFESFMELARPKYASISQVGFKDLQPPS